MAHSTPRARKENPPTRGNLRHKNDSGHKTNCRPLRDSNQDSEDDPAVRIRELEANLRKAESALETANAARDEALQQAESLATHNVTQQTRATEVAPESIDPPPGGVSNAKMHDIQTELGFDDAKWNALRTTVRYAMAAARLNWDDHWKMQKPDKVAKALSS
ncbi:hypothetical protein B0H14DRAFT_3879507, partial [Mycena olivaceomarginata]